MNAPIEDLRKSRNRIPPPSAKLFCSLIYSGHFVLQAAIEALVQEWGGVETISRRLPFDFTPYYEKEMGSALVRKFLVFRDPVEQDSLPALKGTANRVESHFLGPGGARKVNIDPGLLLADKLVLATTKPSANRPYLGSGVYADLSLVYHRGSYRSLPWTYPDYAGRETIEMMNALRNRFLEKRRRGLGETDPRQRNSPEGMP